MYQSTSFCFFYLIPSKSLPNIHWKSLNNGGKFAEIVTWTKPFQVKFPIKRHSWVLILFFTHLYNTCDMRVADGTQLIQRQPIPVIHVAWGWTLKCTKRETRIKCLGKNPKTPNTHSLTHTHTLSQSRYKSLGPLILKNITCVLKSLNSIV